MEVEERVPCEGGWDIPRDEEFDSTSQRQPLGYESN